MSRWKEFLDSLNTPGGHIFVLTGLFIITMGLFVFWKPEIKDVMMIFVGALGNEMRGMIANVNQRTETIVDKHADPPRKGD